MDELIGRTFGPYTIADKIGEGGMAEVYRGYQESLNRYVAIKVLRGELARDQEFIARFRREALAVAKLSHPNILHVYDAGMAQGVYYIVMDYADGGSLKEIIQQGPLSTEQAVSIAIQLADALDYAHRQGLIHRDVKPSNVLMTRDGRPLLTDFGIAKVLNVDTHLTRTGTAIGTPEYMSPEQLQGQGVDGRTDIYAMGVMLFEMLAGWTPFAAPTPMATMYKQMNEDPPPLRQVNINIPEWLGSVVAKTLSKQPDARYQRGSDLADALRQKQNAVVSAAGAAAGITAAQPRPGTPSPIPQTARPDTPTRIESKPRKKSVVPILLVAIVAVVVILGGIAAYLVLSGPGQTGGSPTAVVVVATAPPTDLPQPTIAASPTSLPVVDTPKPEIVIVTATPNPEEPTSEPTAEPPAQATEAAPTAPTEAPTSAPTDAPTQAPTEAPTAAPTQAPTKPTSYSSEPGGISDFENFGTWKRGDEANGTFSQSKERVQQGTYSGKLAYSFATSGNDYVVFQQSHAIDGQPTRIAAWVYGDGSGHFLNVWIKDNGGQVWQVPLGRVSHTGFEEMSGAIDVNQDWPWTHIGGTDNGKVDYPITFQGFVLDDSTDAAKGSGEIFIDDLRADTGTVSPGPSTSPTKESADQPTSQPATGVSGVSGRIAFSAGGALHVVDAASGNDLFAPISNMYQPDIRRDGQLIIANGEGGGKTSLWTINAKTGAFVREQSPFTNDFRPFWAPDAGQFVYDSFHQGGKYHNVEMLYRQTLDSKDDQVLIHSGGAETLGKSPVWMEDDWVAFTGCDYWAAGSKCGIYRMPSWGGQPAMVLPGPLTLRATDNHGAQLLMMSQESGNWEVYIIPNTGGTPRNLSDSAGSHDGLATFSPDGKLVAFVSNRGGGWAVWAVRTDGGGLTKLFNLPAKPSDPSGDWTQERMSWGP